MRMRRQRVTGGRAAAGSIAAITALAAALSAPAGEADKTPFVEQGKPRAVFAVGQAWRQGDGYLECSGTGNLLCAGWRVGAGDFRVRARLSLDRLDHSAASLVLGSDHFGLDGRGKRLFVEGRTLGPARLLGDATAVITPGKPFDVEIERKGTRLTFHIDGKEVFRTRFAAGELGGIGLRPHRATMRVYELAASGALEELSADELPPPKTDLFEAGTDGYATYRIPGIAVTARGTILAYCAARKSGIGDWDDIDIAMRRSIDGGRTWGKQRILVDAGTSTADNPTAIVDHKTGAVHFLYQVDYARCYCMRSDDEGKTFTGPVDITGVFEQFRKEYDWNVIAPGPGHGIQLSGGRLLVPVWLSTGGKRHRPSCVSVIYSDDHGRTWHRGEIVVRHSEEVPNPSETVAVELADGRVMLNIRNESPRHRRLVSFSRDGATGWTRPVFDEGLFEPVCMGSIVRLSRKTEQKHNRILFANPDSRRDPYARGINRARANLSIKLSEDEGRSWPVSKVIEPGTSGYSDLAVAADGTTLCLYESGGIGGNMFHTRCITLARVNVAWLLADPRRRLTETIRVGGVEIKTAAPPPGLVLRQDLGLVTAAAVDGQVVHRARQPADMVLEARATITPGGDYLLMFPDGGHYGGKREKVNDMFAYRSADKGKTWAGPEVAFRIPYNQHGFIPLVPRGSQRIYAFGTQPILEGDHFDGHENAAIGFRYSDDDGRTWSGVTLIQPVNDPGFRGMSVMRMCETDSGTWLVGSHEADWSRRPIKTRQYILRSEDRGKTWTVLPGKRPGGWHVKEFNRMDELRPINLGGGKVLALARTCEGHLWELRSGDDGRTWTDPKPTALVHPDAPPMLFPLGDGKTLVAFHHNRHTGAHFKQDDRSELWVSTSTDEGRTWSEPRFVLANALAETLASGWRNHQCSYLDVFADGEELHLFLPHRWRRVLHLTMRASDLAGLPTRAELERAAGKKP